MHPNNGVLDFEAPAPRCHFCPFLATGKSGTRTLIHVNRSTKSGQRRRRRRKKSSGDRAAAAAVATVEILPGMIPDEDTLAEGIENLEAALKKKKQPERPVLAALQALSSRDLIEQAKAQH